SRSDRHENADLAAPATPAPQLISRSEGTMHTRSRHLLVEYHGCNRALLDDLKGIEALMRVAAKAAGTTIVKSVFHPFAPQGVSGVVVIEESHLSIHTWPE